MRAQAMTLARPTLAAGFHVEVPVAPLLQTALARLGRQAQYARPLSRGGHRAATVQGWFGQAADCIADLARPKAIFRDVETRMDGDGVRIAGRVTLRDPDLVRDIAAGGTVTAYLLTLGYGQGRAFDWLDRDYSAHHVQSDLGGEVLFALGRHAHGLMREAGPAGRLRRVPIQAHGLCGQRRLWDPASVQALLSVFDGDEPGVTVTDTGCFEPLNSLLGLTIRTGPAQNAD